MDFLDGNHLARFFRNHKCHPHFPPFIIIDSDNGHLGNFWMVQQDFFNFRGIDIFTAAPVHILGPIDDVKIAFFIHIPQVSGVKHAVDDRFFCDFSEIPVTGHDGRPFCHDFTDFPCRQGPSAFILDPDVRKKPRLADGSHFALYILFRHHHHRGVFSLSKPLLHMQPAFGKRFKYVCRGSLAAAHDAPHAGRVNFIELSRFNNHPPLVVRAKTMVPRYRCMSSANSLGSNPRRITMVMPALSAGVATINRPPEWKRGIWAMSTSSGVALVYDAIWKFLKNVCSWERTAPLGLPVTPDV